MEKVTKTVFVTTDGSEFLTEREARWYEAQDACRRVYIETGDGLADVKRAVEKLQAFLAFDASGEG